ncbi:GldG family protein [Halobacterium litoreum]|uniref:GldG family protein n=1 Tax=Halobacterium litoreum TaxID=2039234 RepID=A0ABD5NHS6_9EURY|nr:GldG family protein [Halobacterium litoreum]UHH12452.1 GldG family protein [Halobacterium litoreum]
MNASDLARGVGALVVAAAVVLAGAYGAGLALSSPTNAAPAPDAPAYDTSELVADPVDDSGSVTAPSADESKTVVVDTSHGNAIGENSLQPLVDALVAAGHDVRFFSGSSGSTGFGSQSGPTFNSTLDDADALVVASPASAYSAGDVTRVREFADAGGRVLLAADPPSTASTSTTVSVPGLTTGSSASASGQPANLAAEFGVAFGSGYLYDMSENANNFQRVYASGDGRLADGVDRAVFQAATPLTTGDAATPVLTAEVSNSATRDAGTYVVAARNGGVLAVGDTDFLTPDAASAADTDAFASNVAAFLVTGEKTSAGGAGGSTGNSSTVGGSAGSSSVTVEA